MEEIVDCLEYYYDEDFSVPFDIGITEENNNITHNNLYSRTNGKSIICSEYDDEYTEREIQKVILPVKLFFNDYTKRTANNIAAKKVVSSKMSCSSSTDSSNECKLDQSFMMDSHYSLKTRLPLFSMDNGKILANYRLNFDANHDMMLNSEYLLDNDNNNHQIEQSLSDSGNISTTTIDSMLLQQVATDYRNLHGLQALEQQNLPPDSKLWRQIKFLMTYYFAGWSLFQIFKQSELRKRCKRPQIQTTDEIYSYQTRRTTKRIQRYSCTVLELYNNVKNHEKSLESLFATVPTSSQPTSTPTQSKIQHFSCQFPPKHQARQSSAQIHIKQTIYDSSKQSSSNKSCQSQNYPGIGKLQVPKVSRLKSTSLLSQNFHSSLSFLQSGLSDNLNGQTTSEYSFGKPLKITSPQLKQLSTSTQKLDAGNYYTEDRYMHQKHQPTNNKPPPVPQHSNNPSAVNNNKSGFTTVASTKNIEDSRPSQIPRKWGLLGIDYRHTDTDLIAMFDVEVNSSLMLRSPKNNSNGTHSSKHHSNSNTNSHNNNSSINSNHSKDSANKKLILDDTLRIKSLVNEACRAMRQVSDRLTHMTTPTTTTSVASSLATPIKQNNLTMLCDQLLLNNAGISNNVNHTGLTNGNVTQQRHSNSNNNNQSAGTLDYYWSDSPLAAVIDNIFVLLVDGMLHSSYSFSGLSQQTSNNINRRSASKLWLLIEESCRHNPELHQVLISTNNSYSNTTASSTHHSKSQSNYIQKIRQFLVWSLRSNLLHSWIVTLVQNNPALTRFYQPNSFIRLCTSNTITTTPQQESNNNNINTPVASPTSLFDTLLSHIKSLQQLTVTSQPPPVTITRRSYPQSANPSSTSPTSGAPPNFHYSGSESSPPSSSHCSTTSPSQSTTHNKQQQPSQQLLSLLTHKPQYQQSTTHLKSKTSTNPGSSSSSNSNTTTYSRDNNKPPKSIAPLKTIRAQPLVFPLSSRNSSAASKSSNNKNITTAKFV